MSVVKILIGLVAVAGFLPGAWPAEALVISQVQITGGTGKTEEEFVELFNNSPNAANLQGLILAKRTASGNSDIVLYNWQEATWVQPYGFYLWAHGNFLEIAASPDATSSVSSLADNNGVALRLAPADQGLLADSWSWGGSDNGFRKVSDKNPGAGKSLSLADLHATSTVLLEPFPTASPRNSSAAPIFPPAPQPDPEDASTTPPSGDPAGGTKPSLVKISEILPNPEGDDDGAEAVEIYNGEATEVSLEGWLLDDKSEEGPKSGALSLSGSVPAGDFFVVIVPKGYFAMNNSGGDEISLYFSDRSLADSVVYSANAGEGQGWQLVLGNWLWADATIGAANAAPPPHGPSGGGGTVPSPQPASPLLLASSTVAVSEIFFNPEGADDGMEWVELMNSGSATASIAGWRLDDIASATATPGPSAFLLPPGSQIPPHSYIQLVLPESGPQLNNTGDWVRLFNESGALVARVSYPSGGLPGQSYALFADGKWEFSAPTPNATNQIPPAAALFISELLPNPDAGQEEFVEIFNASSAPAYLTGMTLKVGARELILADATLSPLSYWAISEEELPGRLRDSGQQVELLDVYGRQLSIAVYGKSQAGHAYAKVGESFVWTSLPTPGAENRLVLAAGQKAASVKQPQKKQKAAALVQQEPDLSRRLQSLEEEVLRLKSAAAAGPALEQPAVLAPVELQESTQRPVSYLALSLAALALLVALWAKFPGLLVGNSKKS